MFSYLFTLKKFLEHCETISYKTESNKIKELNPEKNYTSCRDCAITPKSNDCNNKCESMPFLVAWLADRVVDANWRNAGKGVGGLSTGEIHAWCRSVCVYMYRIFDALKKAGVPDFDDIAIGLEYYLEREHKGRTDVMIAGFGENDEKRVIVVELKQYSGLETITTESDGGKKWQCSYGTKKVKYDNPSQQVRDYCKVMENSIASANNIDPITFFPCVYLHNMEYTSLKNLHDFFDEVNDGTKGFLDRVFGYNYEGVRLYVGDDIDLKDDPNDHEKGFAAYLKSVIPRGGKDSKGNCAKEIFSTQRERTKTLSVEDLIDALIWDGIGENPYEQYLRPDQRNLLEETCAHVNGAGAAGSADKIIDVVNGGPGSGKTLIAFLLANYCLRNDKTVAFLYRATSTHNVYTDIIVKKIIEAGKEQPEPVRGYIRDLKQPNIAFSDIKKCLAKIDADSSDSVLKKLIKVFMIINYWEDIYGICKNEDKTYDVLIFDEAQRYNGGDKELKELISHGDMAIFLGDALQVISNKENVNPLHIENILGSASAPLSYSYNITYFSVWSQFRCNQDEGYVTWLENKFDIDNSNSAAIFDPPACRPKMNISLENLDFKPEVIDLTDRDDLLHKIDKEDLTVLAGPWIETSNIRQPAKANIFEIVINGKKERFTTAHLGLTYRRLGITNNKQIIDIDDLYGLEQENILVIIGNEVQYDTGAGKIKIDLDKVPEAYRDRLSTKPAEQKRYIKNIYRILLTRGMKKCSIYCMDKDLSDYLKY